MAQLTSYFCPAGLASKEDEYHDAARRANTYAWPGFAFTYDPTLGEIGAAVLRVLTALLMVHHGIDKLENTEAFATGRASRVNARRARGRRREAARAQA